MKNYAKTTIGTEARTELHETLALTGRRNQRKPTPGRSVCSVCAFAQKE